MTNKDGRKGLNDPSCGTGAMLAATASGEPLSLLRLREVTRRTGKSRSSVYRDVAAGTFPAPVKLGERASAWPAAEVDRWIAGRIAARDEGRAA
jgi:prophage regulatory protein